MSNSTGVQVQGATPRPTLPLYRFWENYVLPYGMLVPTLLALVALIISPLIYSLILSFFSWRLTEINTPKTFVGVDNYVLLLNDGAFWNAVGNTLAFVIGTVTIEITLGFAIALLLANIGAGRRLANSIILLPMIITPVVVALIWRYMYDPQFGIVNYFLSLFGVTQEIGWLGRADLAMPAVMLVDIWEMTPFVVLVLHAGIISLPEDFLDAARVDGASYLQIVRYIIIPFLTPLLLLVATLRTMDTIRVFDIIYVLTKGGPGRATETLAIYTYQVGFTYFRMGYAMALSIVTLLIILVVTMFYLRLVRTR
jgi:multiple sugar transport system permease protein